MTRYDELSDGDRLDMAAATLWEQMPADVRRKVQNHLSFTEQDVVQKGVRNGRKVLRECRNDAKNRK